MKITKANLRTKDIHLRVTEEEYALFRKKGKEYLNTSKMIVQAVKDFKPNNHGINKLTILNNYSEKMEMLSTQINKIGNNLNQLAHYANILLMAEHPTVMDKDTLKYLLEQIEENNKIVNGLCKDYNYIRNHLL